MAIVREQTKTQLYTGVSTVLTLGATPADDSLLVLIAIIEDFSGESITSITQTGATWQKAVHLDGTLAARRVEIWYAEGVSSAGTGITVTVSGALAGAAGYIAAEYSGIATSSALDKTATNEEVILLDPVSTGATAKIAEGNELWIGAFGVGASATVGTPENGGEVAAQLDAGSVAIALVDRDGKLMPQPAELRANPSVLDNAFCAIATFKSTAALDPSISLVQSKTLDGSNGAGPFALTLDSAPTQGNVLVLAASLYEGVTITGVTQTGVTWTKAEDASNGSGSSGVRGELWYGTVGAGATAGISIAVDGSTQAGFAVTEYEGVSDLDVSASSSGNSGTASTGTTASTAGAPEILAGVLAFAGSVPPFSAVGDDFADVLRAKGGGASATAHGVALVQRPSEASETAGTTATLSGSQPWAGAVLALQAVVPGVPTVALPPGFSTLEAGPEEIDFLDTSRDKLRELVIVALFSDRRAEAGDAVPDGTLDRRGFWGDVYERDGRRLGSRLWLLDRAPITAATIDGARQYAEEALAALVEDGHAEEVTVTTERNGLHRLDMTITLTRPEQGAAPLELRFEDVFQSSQP